MTTDRDAREIRLVPDSELLFKAITAILFVAYSAIRRYFQRTLSLAPTVSVKHVEREKRFFTVVAITLIPIVVYALTPFLDFLALPLPAWLRWLGALVLLDGVTLFYFAHASLGTNWSGILELREGHELVDRGPYRFVRHPMYTAMLAIGMGLGLLSANALVWSYFVAVAAMVAVRVRDEETMLRDAFGQAYDDYCARTGRLLPSLSSFAPRAGH